MTEIAKKTHKAKLKCYMDTKAIKSALTSAKLKKQRQILK